MRAYNKKRKPKFHTKSKWRLNYLIKLFTGEDCFILKNINVNKPRKIYISQLTNELCSIKEENIVSRNNKGGV